MPCLASELTTRVALAYKAREPLNITAAGTKSFLTPPSVTGTPLDVTGHSGIVEYDPAELVMVARTGTPLKEIEEVLREHGQMLGFEPPFVAAGGTLGGAVACGLAGPRRAYTGAVRDFILGATFINGKGESITAGGKVMKNVAGFDLFRPMARSMGTLGVVLQIALQVLPLPDIDETLVHEESDELIALQKMNQWPVETQAISASSWDGKHIRIRLSGSASGIAHARAHIGGEIIDGIDYWRDLRNFKMGFFQGTGRLWRVSVAPMSESLRVNARQLIDWGGAQRWLKTDETPAAIRARAAQLGGFADCFSTDSTVATFHPMTGPVLEANKRLKAALDPAGILNPGRLCPEL